jgi:hypothetical protein
MINPGWRGEYYLQQDLEGRGKFLKRLVGSLHLEPAMRQRVRHFDMERISDRYRLDAGDWDVVMEAGREYVPVGEREDIPADLNAAEIIGDAAAAKASR